MNISKLLARRVSRISLCKSRSARSSLCSSLVRWKSSSHPRRAVMYIPANSQKFINKAALTDLDTAVLEMEDGVAPSKKAEAREVVLHNLESETFKGRRTEVCVRINAMSSGFAEADAKRVLTTTKMPHSFCLPKCESADDIEWLSAQIDARCAELGIDETAEGGCVEIIGMIETPTALMRAASICAAATHRLSAIIFGGDDYAAAIGAIRSQSNSELWYARNAALAAAKANGLQAIDIVFINFKDAEGFKRESEEGFHLGFDGKQVIHPSQVTPAQECFSPEPKKIQWAQKVVAECERQYSAGVGAFEVDGAMIDAPTVTQAANILNKAKSAGLI